MSGYPALTSLLFLLAACASAPEGPSTVRSLAGERALEVEARDGERIALAVAGAGEPTLLFLHGWGADRSVWRRQWPAFAARQRVVAIDLPGHGASSRGRRVWSLGAYGRDVCAVLEALDLRDVVIVGHGMGGLVALEAAALAPGRVAALVGVESLLDVGRQVPYEVWNQTRSAWERDFEGTCALFVAQMFRPGTDAALVRSLSEQVCATPPEVALPLLEEITFYDERGALARAALPVRCINADLRPTAVASNRRLAADYDARVVPHSGHFLMLEDPVRFNRALVETLAQL